jgi:hypothetical protein
VQKVHKQDQDKRALDPTVVRLKKNDSHLFLLPEEMFKAGKLAEIVEDLNQLEKEEDPLYHEEWVRKNVFYPRIIEGGSEEDRPEPTLDKEPPDYIRVDFSDNGATPYDLRINSYSDKSEYIITCPSDFLTESSSPLSDVGLDDSVIMELNLKGDRLGTEEDHLRIYTREDYFRYRHEEWCRTGSNPVPREFPVIGGIVSWFLDRTPDLSGPYEGERFQFVVFDAHHSVFREQSDLLEHNVPSSDLFFQVKESGRLPRHKADIEIWWDPRGGDESGFDASIKLYDEENCTETSVILPKQGYFLVKSYTQDGMLETWLGRSSSERFQESRGWERKVGNGWYGFFPEDQDNEEGFRLYVPAKTMD